MSQTLNDEYGWIFQPSRESRFCARRGMLTLNQQSIKHRPPVARQKKKRKKITPPPPSVRAPETLMKVWETDSVSFMSNRLLIVVQQILYLLLCESHDQEYHLLLCCFGNSLLSDWTMDISWIGCTSRLIQYIVCIVMMVIPVVQIWLSRRQRNFKCSD